MLVYLIENTKNGKRYVGQTIRSLDWRWRNHVRAAERGVTHLICSAIRKYGPDAFVRSVLATANSQEELDALETKFILELGTLSPAGYNLTTGGEHPIVTDEVRAKQSAKSKGHKRWTPEAIAKSVATRLASGGYVVSDATRTKNKRSPRKTDKSFYGWSEEVS
jgi:group I intron endonuclease